MSRNQSYIYSNVQDQSEMSAKQIVDRILRSGKMSRQDHTLLTSTVFNKRDVHEGERRQINRVFNHIQTGQLKLVNW
ncbi:hypothetical protein [Anabaena sp. UHCC 0399]|uniref:hypothetical protein n=1 Tax=Anabaena sp. UHCC 0399 TaxID=3110238 RepID=UPI0016875F3E|nr:hypothetical protein [Anabaena sp. UHCC 0399]MBD2362978.1 hypothetical protein [Anabaena minutissima FACHB-250]MEA5565348.1 hypothetical protein [Anabaena sp. UHCC 0399]